MMQPDSAELARVRRAIVARESAAAMPLLVLDAGRSLVVATATNVIVRAGRIQGAAERYEREATLLGALRGQLPVNVPTPRWVAGPDADLPHGAIALDRLPGERLGPNLLGEAQRERLASDLGHVTAALHAIPIGRHADRLPDARDSWRELASMWDALTPELRTRLAPEEFVALGRWWQALEPPRHRGSTLVHGDLWYENLLVDAESGALLAVLDFEDAHLGDPATDFAPQPLLGEQFAIAVRTAYLEAGGALGEGFEARVQLWRQFAAIRSAHYSQLVGDEPSLAGSVELLRRRVLS